MGQILKNWRILAATLFSVVLVVGAYVLAHGIGSPPVAEASEETALLQSIATKDSDGDGLPDWEEALYGTSPTVSDTFNLGMTDGEAVAKGLIVPKAIADVPVATSTPDTSDTVDPSLPPAPAAGTLTAAFAQNFFNLYVTAKQNAGGDDLTDSQMSDVASQAISSLSSMVVTAPDYKTASDLVVSGSGADAMTAFAISAQAVFLKNTNDATLSDIDYLKNGLNNDDTTAYPHIASIAKGYRGSAAGLAVLPVPQELASDDLMLINALMRMSQIDDDLSGVDADPVAAMLALQQYPTVIAALGQSLMDISQLYAAAGIKIPDNAPGGLFVNLVSYVTSQTATTTTP